MNALKILLVLLSTFFLTMMCNQFSDEEVTKPSQNNQQEFTSSSFSDITLQYKIQNDSLHCILSAQTSGWIAVGFNPTNRMKDANFIIGYVSNGTISVRDDWGVGMTQHQSDVSLGGIDNITIVNGSENGGLTEIEFLIPLDSGDPYDRSISSGQTYPIILAKGNSDSFTSIHSSRGASTITL